jgi:hypothetical protein
MKKPIAAADAEKFFWEVIETSNKQRRAHWSKYEADEHLETLTTNLAKHDRDTLILFERVLIEKLHRLYTAEIAELSFVLESEFTHENGKVAFNEYLSADGFIYFRCWLILKGRAFFDDITSDINTFVSGKYSFNIADCWAEGLLYVADEAYAVSHTNDGDSEIRDAVSDLFPDLPHYDSPDQVMNRTPVGGTQLQQMYPHLVGEIANLRS